MRIEYDPVRDLLYIWFGAVGTKAAETVIAASGVHADLGADGKLVGLEVPDATTTLGEKPQFEVSFPLADITKAA